MTVSGESVVVTTLASTTAVAVGLPIWLLASVGLMGGLIAVLNSEKMTYKTVITYLISGAMISATGTNIIMDKLFSGTKFDTELSIGIAFLLGLVAHLIISKILQKKEKIIDLAIEQATESAIGKIKKVIENDK